VTATPRIEINLKKIHHNASELVKRFSRQGISITGVCKATLGSPEVANTLLRAGVSSLGDSHIENIESMRHTGVRSEMVLIRSPMLSQVSRVVASVDVSLNTEISVIRALSRAASSAGRSHGVILMVELGDRREGLMPVELFKAVGQTLGLPNIRLQGIGTNLACRSGIAPDARNMAELSALAQSIETTFDYPLETISGGNSANLDWGLSGIETGRVNNLRLGEAILLGREPLHRQPIRGLYTDAFTLVAEVIESNVKPSRPVGTTALAAYGAVDQVADHGLVMQAILAIGRQDINPDGLMACEGISVMGASSDHLIVWADKRQLAVGVEVPFQLDYGALVSAMTSPFVAKVFHNGS